MPPKDFHHPFEPYDIQQQFMEALYDCIEQGQVGIFESPTGTGKSLSLICGSLTWLREHKRKTFDEAMASVTVADDEPQWMVDHAKDVRSREIRQMRADLEARLKKIRDREERLREQIATGEPAHKKQKQGPRHSEADSNDEQFVLDDYNSDDDEGRQHSIISAETTRMMTSLGLLSSGGHAHEIEDEPYELKIYFCSRTHSQLSQFIGELSRVGMPPGLPPEDSQLSESGVRSVEEVKHLTLGSRRNLCINPGVVKLTSQVAINERCIELQQTSTPAHKKCQFLPTDETADLTLDFRDHALAKIRDIEDLGNLGTKLQICPYYASRSGIGPAEIVTLPYPLLLLKSARDALGVSLENHVVIIDEAHNLINAIESTYSTQISDRQLERAKNGLIVYLQRFRNRLKGSNRVYLTQVVRVIDSLLHFVDGVKGLKKTGSVVDPGALLAGKAVDQINLTKLVRYIIESRLARKVEGYARHCAQPEMGKKQKPTAPEVHGVPEVPALTHVQNFLMTLMNPSREGRFFWSKESNAVVLRYMLLDPSEHFRDIVDEARAVVLAGGTMSPMEDYKQQLFPYLESITTFSCGHLIPTSNLFVRAITSDRHGRLDFTFKSRSNNTARLGDALLRVASNVNAGMVVFFPSYEYLDSVIRIWKAEQLYLSLEDVKPIFSDSRTVAAEETFRSYSEAVRGGRRGALLLSVIGGKLSEGINFSDELGRCIVVVGLPYPNLETPEWKAKLQYLEERAVARGGEAQGTASREHAENVCMRSVNQAIGRAIRHKNDWASILLFDARYGEGRVHAKLPGWIKDAFDAKAMGGVVDVAQGLEAFFKRQLKLRS